MQNELTSNLFDRISTIGNRTSQSSTLKSTPNISSAATVANEQKASKVLGVVFFT